MPDSEPAEPDSRPGDGAGASGGGGGDPGGDRGGTGEPEEALSALEASVERLVEAYGELQERVERAEGVRRSLADALAGAAPEELTPEEAARKFRELVEENRRLREVVEEGRERAQRIRSRLIMMEDEL